METDSELFGDPFHFIAGCLRFFTFPGTALGFGIPAGGCYLRHILLCPIYRKKDIYAKIEQQGDTANRLLDQITIGYNNALLVQEIGQAVSSILDIDTLLKFVMETLQKGSTSTGA